MIKILVSACLMTLLSLSPVLAKIGGGDINFPVKTTGDVLYSHDFHVAQKKLGCTECHYQIFARMAHNARDKATMADMRNGKSCGTCHNGVRAFGVDKNCGRCHHASVASSWW